MQLAQVIFQIKTNFKTFKIMEKTILNHLSKYLNKEKTKIINKIIYLLDKY